MSIRLTLTGKDGWTVVHVDGWLTARELADLESTVRSVSGAVVLDLSNLLSADDAGVAALRALAGEGVQLSGVTPYMSLLLDAEPEPRASPPKGRGRRTR